MSEQMQTDETAIVIHYVCGLCNTILTEQEVDGHACFEGFQKISQTENHYLYPMQDDGTWVMPALDEGAPGGKEESNSKYDFAEKLIINVQMEEDIWNIKSSPALRTATRKNAAWQRISNIMGAEETELKKKWKNITDTHRRNFTSIQQSKKSGSAAKHVKPWPLYEMLSFLRDVELVNQTTSTNVTPSTSRVSGVGTDDDPTAGVPTVEECFSDMEEYEFSRPQVKRVKKNSNSHAAISASEIQEIVKAVSQTAPAPVIQIPPAQPAQPQTASAAFGKYIVRSLEELPYDDRIRVQNEVSIALNTALQRVARDRPYVQINAYRMSISSQRNEDDEDWDNIR